MVMLVMLLSLVIVRVKWEINRVLGLLGSCGYGYVYTTFISCIVYNNSIVCNNSIIFIMLLNMGFLCNIVNN